MIQPLMSIPNMSYQVPSHHITSDLASLNQVAHFKGSKKIKIVNDQGLPV